MTHGTEKFYEIKRLAEQDLSDYAIARLTGVSRPTVQRWRHRTLPPGARYGIEPKEWRIANPEPYCYLLGVYLGDGNILHRPPNGWTLRVACDQRYPEIEAEVMSAMRTTFRKRSATRRHCSAGASDIVQISHPCVGRAFPQHGAGRKHLRRIALTAWQLELTRSNPSVFVRGLIHSDGCRSASKCIYRAVG